MVYKANFKPSQLACPKTHNYVYITDEVKKLIDENKEPQLCSGQEENIPKTTFTFATETEVSEMMAQQDFKVVRSNKDKISLDMFRGDLK